MSAIVINDSIAEEYHKDIRLPDGVKTPTISAGDLTIAATQSFAAYLSAKQSQDTDSTAAQHIGSAMHNAILVDDPDKGSFEIGEFNDYRTKDSKAWKEEVISRGHTPILRKEYDTTMRPMLDSFLQSGIAKLVRKPESKPEQAVYWEDPTTSLWQRARIDLMPETSAYKNGIGQIDYKTSAPKMFKNYIRTFLQDHSGLLRLAHYLTAAYHATGVWGNYWLLVQCKEAPYSTKLIMLDVGRALSHALANLQGGPLVIGDYEIKPEEVCIKATDPQTGQFLPMPSDAELNDIYLAFIHGMRIRAQMLQCLNFCIKTNSFPHPEETAPSGITTGLINYSVQNLAIQVDEHGVITPGGFVRDEQGKIRLSQAAHLEAGPQLPTPNQSEGEKTDDKQQLHRTDRDSNSGSAGTEAPSGGPDSQSGEPTKPVSRGAPPPAPSAF